MPRTAFFSKEKITEAGLQIVRTKGEEALTARALGKVLQCSVSPIFTVYPNMDKVKEDVRKAALALFSEYVGDVLDYYPPFKELGIRIVRFATREQNLFRMLFLGKNATYSSDIAKLDLCLDDIEKEYGMNDSQVKILFRQIWPLACGLAVINAQNPEAYSDDEISEILSCEFTSMMHFLKSGQQVVNITPHRRDSGDSGK
ncbi:MAG: hypothetical protein ACI399_04140 [Candidatus Cryptobacteroides sp.]